MRFRFARSRLEAAGAIPEPICLFILLILRLLPDLATAFPAQRL